MGVFILFLYLRGFIFVFSSFFSRCKYADEDNNGIHCLSISPSYTLAACGGENPCDVVVYKLPELIPLCILEGFTDWCFGCFFFFFLINY
jgi:hypothetical protein